MTETADDPTYAVVCWAVITHDTVCLAGTDPACRFLEKFATSLACIPIWLPAFWALVQLGQQDPARHISAGSDSASQCWQRITTCHPSGLHWPVMRSLTAWEFRNHLRLIILPLSGLLFSIHASIRVWCCAILTIYKAKSMRTWIQLDISSKQE